MTLTIATGTTSGAFVPAVQQVGGAFSMFFRPILFTEKLPVLGDAGDIILVDFSKYCIGMRQEVVLDKSNAPGWTEDLVDFRVILRCDGQGTWDQPMTPKNGDTLSWCVCIEERGE